MLPTEDAKRTDAAGATYHVRVSTLEQWVSASQLPATTTLNSTVAVVSPLSQFPWRSYPVGTLARTYYFVGSQRVALRETSALTTTAVYLYGDALGSVSLATAGNGTPLSQQRYAPFGAVRWVSGTLPTDRTFTGQRVEGGLLDYNARYYSLLLGRFLSADSIVPQPGDPQSLNRYAYTLNNPLRYIDPTGHSCTDPDDTSQGCATPASVGGASLPGGAAAPLTVNQNPTFIQRIANEITKLFGSLFPNGTQQDNQLAPEESAGVNVETVKAAVTKFSGALPVAKGQAGVAQAIQDVTSHGSTVLGKEVTFENSNGVRARVDFVYRDSMGKLWAAEVKNGPNAALTTNQAEVYPELATVGAIPRGRNATQAGFIVGKNPGPIPIDYILYP